MNPLLPDDPDSKLNACVHNVLRIWEESKANTLTQLLFCDLSTPKNDGTFNVYDDIKTKLMAAGVPEKEIAFIHTADTEAKKKELFAKVRTGLAGQHPENGSRHQLSGSSGGSAPSGCGLASFRYDPA